MKRQIPLYHLVGGAIGLLMVTILYLKHKRIRQSTMGVVDGSIMFGEDTEMNMLGSDRSAGPVTDNSA